MEEEDELDDEDEVDLPDHKPGLSKKKEDSDDEEGGAGAAVGEKARRNEMAMEAFSRLMSVLES